MKEQAGEKVCYECGKLVDLSEKKHKYGAEKVEIYGIWFDSKKEGKRYSELKAMGVWPIELQPKFDLTVNGLKICEYRADFAYEVPYGGWKVVEDAKGVKTPVYRLKKKLMKAIYGIEISEV